MRLQERREVTVGGGPLEVRDGQAPDAHGVAFSVRERFWVIGPVGVLLAFFWQPALRFVAPFILTSISSLLVVGLVLAARGAATKNRKRARLQYACAFALGAGGVGEAIYFATLALAVSDANDQRCLALETRMLGNETGRGPNAALFQALGCRPQSTNSVNGIGEQPHAEAALKATALERF